MNQNNQNCARQTCSCATQNESKYCSAACQAAVEGGVTEISCGCGHSGCTGEIK